MDLSGVSIDQYVLLNKQSHSVIAFDKYKEILEDIIDRLVKLRVESEAKTKNLIHENRKRKMDSTSTDSFKREGKIIVMVTM